MTTPLTVLLFFAGWALMLVVMIGVHRWMCVFTGKIPKGGFPSDVAPEGESFYRRVLQAHKNCIENLAIFGALVLVISVRGLDMPILDTLALTVMGARILQTLTHISVPQTRYVVMTRFGFYLVQVVCFAWILFIAITA